MRITNKDLESLVKRINIITDSPLEPHTRVNGKYTANIGCYHLSYAYGGVSLQRMHNSSGGVESVIKSGHVSKRELYNLMHAFITGLENKNEV